MYSVQWIQHHIYAHLSLELLTCNRLFHTAYQYTILEQKFCFLQHGTDNSLGNYIKMY